MGLDFNGPSGAEFTNFSAATVVVAYSRTIAFTLISTTTALTRYRLNSNIYSTYLHNRYPSINLLQHHLIKASLFNRCT